MPTKLHDRVKYIDDASAWLSANLDWLRPDLLCAMREWIAIDLAGWRDGDPPAPAIEDERLSALFGTADPARFFADPVASGASYDLAGGSHAGSAT